MKMPTSFRMGIHRIKVARPVKLSGAQFEGVIPPRCPITPPPPKYEVLGEYAHGVPKGRHTWKASYSYRKKLLSVIRPLRGSIARDVLAHELTHAMYDHFSLQDVVPAKYEEAIVEALGKGWLEMVRRNPRVIEYLQTDDDT